MVHSSSFIAAGRFLDADKFKEYLAAHDVGQNDDGTISTYYVNSAVESYIKHIGGEQYNADRCNLLMRYSS